MRVYHFANRKYGLEDIVKRRLKIATLNDLNDPFELRGVSLTDPNERRAFEMFREEFARRWGMLCFSLNWNNPVQWSHYGDRHTGLCMGFDVPENFVTRVVYRSRLHQQDIVDLLKGGDLGAADKAMHDLLRTKYSHWRYERETRLFAELNEPDKGSGLYFEDFGENLILREVIVGHRATISRAELSDALGNLESQVAVTKARLAFKSFRVVRQRNNQLWL